MAPVSNIASGAKPAASQLRFAGIATSEGLRQAKELGPAARAAQFAIGSASYTATLGFRSGVPELQINSNLVGMALNLPAPLTKTAEAALPVRFESAVLRPAAPAVATRLKDRLQLDVGRLASVIFVRDISGPEPHVQSGAIAVGLGPDEAAPLPDAGVVANLNIPRLDLEAWTAVADKLGAMEPLTRQKAPRRVRCPPPSTCPMCWCSAPRSCWLPDANSTTL